MDSSPKFDLTPNRWGAWFFTFTRLLQAKGQLPQAISEYREALRINPPPEIRRNSDLRFK